MVMRLHCLVNAKAMNKAGNDVGPGLWLGTLAVDDLAGIQRLDFDAGQNPQHALL